MIPSKRPSQIFWGLLLAGMLVAGSVCMLFFLPYGQLKPLADHISRRGHLDSFTIGVYAKLAEFLPWVGILLVLATLAAGVFHRRTQAWIHRLVGFLAVQLRVTWRDTVDFWRVMCGRRRPSWWAVLAVTAISLVAIFTRLAFVNRPFQHDEAYTFEAFAVRPFFKIITDYSLPNNHVLHTILVRISYLLFGDSPLAVRLPALAAGVLMVPATYFVAGRLYTRSTAILSAALVAAAPVLIGFSTDARGYTLLALITLGVFALGIYVKQHRNRFAWLLLSVLSALGFYTLPIMLYPYGILMVWLFISVLAGDYGKDYGRRCWGMVKYLIFSGLVTVALTLILYTPIFIYSGVASVISNSFVSPLSWIDFRQTLPVRLLETWQGWTQDVPVAVVYLLVAGAVLSLVFHRKISRHRFPIQVAALIWITVTFLIQRPNPWERVWTYLFAPVMIWASAGLMASFILRSKIRLRGKINLDTLVSSLLALAVLSASLVYGINNIPEQNAVKDIEAAAIFLSPKLQTQDRIAMDYPMDVPFWYYARLHGIGQDYIFNVLNRPYEHVYVIVNTNYQQTVQSVLTTRAKDGVFCNPATIQKIKTIDYTEIYECNRQ